MPSDPNDNALNAEPAESRADRSDTVSALERGISVLRCFSEDRPVLGYADVARMTGIPRPTVNRLVATLLAMGMLKSAPAADRFMLGPGVVSLARVFLGSLDVRAAARPSMQALAEEVGASVYLAVRDGMEMVLIEACRPRSSMLSARLDVGSRAPLPNSALGRAYLSALPEAQRTQLLDSMRLLRGPEWDALAPNMQRAIDEARRLGYCLSLGEFHREINSVSVPLIGPGDEIMALNGGGAAFVFSEERLRNELAPRLHDIALSIARDIGGHVPVPRP
ncbi:IclR family transcriptional regulator [Variovorax guangxiensis]|uniref:IclR family transcriptional regulator n=1 Tax=Variovorax guangxiensis TaxID=1775474 RepID=UPI002864AA4E|nr:IclR family transcriptional regulator [Variovorax guangxiensis]MDR6858842.1 DNA-binding IclR family transcriptional regulator [Variovorax guangxiensis]